MNDTATPVTTDERLRELGEQAFRASALRGTSSLAAWTTYLADVREVVNHYRGLEVADLLFLDGLRLREIVDRVLDLLDDGETLSHQAVAEWMRRYGPATYLTVAEHDGQYTLARVPIMGTIQTRREITGLQELGRRIAPARWEIGDDVDPQRLWWALESGHSRHSPAPADLFTVNRR
jgi:hypothetical protein